MPYLFTCPHCQSQTRVEDRYSGQSGQCVSCGRPIQLPEFAGTPATTATRPPESSWDWLRWLMAGGLVLVLFATVVFIGLRYGNQGIQRLQSNRQRGLCIQNLEKIAAALNNYALDHGSYPPPTTYAADGQPLHSWRVLILPYLGYQEWYDQYRLDEPWSSTHNQKLAFKTPNEYLSPAATPGFTSSCSYFLITGPGTLFPQSGPLGPNDVVDDPGKTMLLVESATPPLSTLQWIEPGDFKIGTLTFQVGSDVGGSHAEGVTMATVDGTGHWLAGSTPAGVFRALISPRGGEAIRDDVLQ